MNDTIHENTSGYAGPIIPQLNSGDVLSREEYLRSYEASPEELKAERINGRVCLMNSVRARFRCNLHMLLGGRLFAYAMASGLHASCVIAGVQALAALSRDEIAIGTSARAAEAWTPTVSTANREMHTARCGRFQKRLIPRLMARRRCTASRGSLSFDRNTAARHSIRLRFAD